MASETSTEVIHVRIDTVVLDRVNKIAKNEDRHKAYIIQRLLVEAMDARDNGQKNGGKK